MLAVLAAIPAASASADVVKIPGAALDTAAAAQPSVLAPRVSFVIQDETASVTLGNGSKNPAHVYSRGYDPMK